MQYRTYQVRKIKNLRILAAIGWTFAIFLATLNVHALMSKHGKEESAVIDKQAEEAKVKARIDALLEEKRLSQLRKFIREKNPNISQYKAAKIAEYEVKYSKKYGIDLNIGAAISLTESTYKKDAETWCCVGIKGINFYAHKDEYNIPSKDSLRDIEYNIEIGYKMMARHMKTYKNIDLALQRYYGSTVPAENVDYRIKVRHRAAIIDRRLS